MGSDRFFVVPPIDMALLNEKDSVMESVLSSLLYYSDQQSNELSQSSSSSKRLFNQDNNFRRWNDFSSGRSSSEQDKIALFQEFKKCLSEVRTLQSKVRSNKSLDSMSVDLDSLYQLGNSFDLKGDFYKLLCTFFKFFGYDIENSFLVVQLDDPDLQVAKAYEAMEQIRQYLSLPNVVVIIATDLEQLRLLLDQHYCNEFCVVMNREAINYQAIQQMSATYLEKLIPPTHMIYLPKIQSLYHTGPLVLRYHKTDGKVLEGGELVDWVLNTIYQKTGLIFIEHRYYMHDIIPNTLRGIAQLFRLLDDMPNPPLMPTTFESLSDENGYESVLPLNLRREWLQYCQARKNRVELLLENLRKFENYFLNDWCSSNLNQKHREIILEIQDDANSSQSVSNVVYILRNWTKDDPERVMTDRDTQDKYDYISLIDLADPEKTGFTRDACSFGFALHTFFSIQFNKMALQKQFSSIKSEIKGIDESTANDRVFSFDYSDLQERLQPQVFDSLGIQMELNKMLGKSAPDICFPISLSAEMEESVKEHPENWFFIRIEEKLNELGEKETTYYCDLLHYFYQALSRPITFEDFRSIRSQRVMLNMQDCATFVCCNWDVQDQISKSMIGSRNNAKGFAEAINSLRTTAPGRYINQFFSYIFAYLKERGAPLPIDFEKIEKDEDGTYSLLPELLFTPEGETEEQVQVVTCEPPEEKPRELFLGMDALFPNESTTRELYRKRRPFNDA